MATSSVERDPSLTGYVKFAAEEISQDRITAVINIESNRHFDSHNIGLAIFAGNCIYAIELIDFNDFELFESIFIQYRVTNCIVPLSTESEGTKRTRLSTDFFELLGNSLQRIEVQCSYRPQKDFSRVKADETISKVQKLRVQNDDCISEYSSCYTELERMPAALVAVALIIQVITDRGESGASIELKIGEIDRFLYYDSLADKALSIFPNLLKEGRSIHIERVENPRNFDTDGNAPDEPTFAIASKRSVHSLFNVLNQTRTPMGERTLRKWLRKPLRDISLIKARQSMVDALVSSPQVRNSIRESSDRLFRLPDIEKVLNRLSNSASKTALADLLTIYRCNIRLSLLRDDIAILASDGCSSSDPHRVTTSGAFKDIHNQLSDILVKLEKFDALVEELIDSDRLISGKDHRFGTKWIQIRPSLSPKLSSLQKSFEEIFEAMEKERFEVCKIVELDVKVVHLENNPIYGYHFRVTKKKKSDWGKKFPNLHILSVQKGGYLFSSTKLKSLSTRFVAVKQEYDIEQQDIIRQGMEVASTYEAVLKKAVEIIGEVDCFSTLAHVAAMNDWVLPLIVTNTTGEARPDVILEGLRHPILEYYIGTNCVPSNFTTSLGRGSIITGPNNGGKSTFLRAVALCSILTQIGSFVPASRAQMPIFDKILTRVGSYDCSAKGASTFMVEMQEIGTILNRVTTDTLVIIDELGRGTSTHDGFGIAWAVVERLAESNPLLLFATHFHELSLLEKENKFVQNLSVNALVPADGSSVTMLYNVSHGPCMSSYGVEVAKMLKFPPQIIDDASKILESLENKRDCRIAESSL